MNWLDWLLVIILGVSFVAGLVRGIARIGIGFAATIVGLVLGFWFYGVAGGFFQDYVSHKMISNAIGFGIVFFAVVAIGGLVSFALAKFFKWAGLTWLDRLMGGLLGLVRGAVLCLILVMAIMTFSRKPPPKAVVESEFAPYLVDASGVMVAMAPRELKDGFWNSYYEVKKWWRKVVKKPVSPLEKQTL